MPSFVVHRIAKLLDMQAQELVSWIEEAKLVLHLEFREEAAGAMLGELRLNPKKSHRKRNFQKNSNEHQTTRGANQNQSRKLFGRTSNDKRSESKQTTQIYIIRVYKIY